MFIPPPPSPPQATAWTPPTSALTPRSQAGRVSPPSPSRQRQWRRAPPARWRTRAPWSATVSTSTPTASPARPSRPASRPRCLTTDCLYPPATLRWATWLCYSFGSCLYCLSKNTFCFFCQLLTFWASPSTFCRNQEQHPVSHPGQSFPTFSRKMPSSSFARSASCRWSRCQMGRPILSTTAIQQCFIFLTNFFFFFLNLWAQWSVNQLENSPHLFSNPGFGFMKPCLTLFLQDEWWFYSQSIP